jgi:hypothetical protein
MDWFRRHMTYANVVATLALFLALGGVSYAALKLPKNSVGSKQIKKNAVTSTKVKNGSLKKGDFAAGSLPAGAAGPVGPIGPKGATGTFGSITVQHLTADADLADNTKGSYTAFCPAGQIAIGGGARGDFNQSEGTVITTTRPAISVDNAEAPENGQTFNGWRATVFNPSGGITTGIRPEVWVICATPVG